MKFSILHQNLNMEDLEKEYKSKAWSFPNAKFITMNIMKNMMANFQETINSKATTKNTIQALTCNLKKLTGGQSYFHV